MDLEDLRTAVGSRAEVRRLEAGDVLFRRGEAARGMHGVLHGRVRLCRHTVEGVEVPVHRARAGETFSEAALFSEVYHCDAVAETPAETILFPTQEVRHLIQADPVFAMAFAGRLAHMLQGLRGRIETRDIRSAADRVIASVSLLPRDPDGWARIEPDWKTFAAEIGLTHEALYRTLKRLEAAGRLRRDGRRVQVR